MRQADDITGVIEEISILDAGSPVIEQIDVRGRLSADGETGRFTLVLQPFERNGAVRYCRDLDLGAFADCISARTARTIEDALVGYIWHRLLPEADGSFPDDAWLAAHHFVAEPSRLISRQPRPLPVAAGQRWSGTRPTH